MEEKAVLKTNIIRKVLGDLLLAAFTLLTADVVIVMLRRIRTVVLKADYQNIFLHELILCAILLLFALDVRFDLLTKIKGKIGTVVGWSLRSILAVLTAVILFFCGRVVLGGLVNTAAPANHAVVLGMALQNGQPTKDLISRLETAQKYLENSPEAVLILTGGNADASGRTEAEVMRVLLEARGVPNDKLLLEDQAETTKENFENTVRMLSSSEPVVLISSDYHMDRAVSTAKKAGFTKVLRLPAPSDCFSYGANMMWEVILDLNDLI